MKISLFVLVVGSVFFGGIQSWAVDSSTSSSLPSQFGLTPPASMTALNLQGVNLACTGIAGGITDMASAAIDVFTSVASNPFCANLAAPAPVAPGAVCPGVASPPDASSLVCPMPADLQNVSACYKARIIGAYSVLSCRDRQIQNLNSQVACMKNAATELDNALQGIRGAMDANFAAHKKDFDTLTSMEDDRKSQLEEVLARIAGNKDNGAEGIDTVLKDLTAAQQAFRGEAQQIKTAQAIVESHKKMLQEAKPRVISARARDCFFDQATTDLHCDLAQKDSVSVVDHVLCRYEQTNLPKDGLGKVQTNGPVADKVASTKSSLAGVFKKINSLMPTQKDIPQTPEELAAFQKDKKGITSLSDFEAKVTANIPNLGPMTAAVKDVVIKRMRACYAEASTSYKVDTAATGGTADMTKNAVSGDTDSNQNAIGNLLEKYSSLWNRGMRAMTGMEHPNTISSLNIDSCVSTGAKTALSPDKQLSCVTDLQANLRLMLDSQSKNVGVKGMLVAPNNHTAPNDLTLNYQCFSLIGCKKVLEAQSTYIKNESKKLGKYKTDYVSASNNGVTQFMNSTGAQLKGKNAALLQQITDFNSKLKGLGYPEANSVAVSYRKGEQLSADDKTGLLKTPTNVTEAVSATMQPPLIDTQSTFLNDATDGVGAVTAGIAGDRKTIRDAEIGISAAIQKCRGTSVKSAVDRLQSAVDSVSSGNCAYLQDLCDSKKDSSLFKAAEAVQAISGDTPGIDSGQIANMQSSLDSGIRACQQKGGGLVTLDRDIAKAQKNVDDNPKDAGFADVLQKLQARRSTEYDNKASPSCNAVSTRIVNEATRLGTVQSGVGAAGAGF